MKFFTAEWYAAQYGNVMCDFKADARAEHFDEAYYEMLYARACKKACDDGLKAHEVSRLGFETRFWKPFLDAEEISVECYDVIMKVARRTDAEKPPFDAAQVVRDLDERLESKARAMRELLPEEILRKVADMRVLALGYVAPHVLEEISARCERLTQIGRRGAAAYREHLDSIWDRIPMDIQENLFALHDECLGKPEWVGQNLKLPIDEDGHVYIRSVTFENCEILNMDEPLEGAGWLYVEFDFTEDGRYEVGVLLVDPDGEDGARRYKTFELRATNITFDRSKTLEEEAEDRVRFDEKIDRLVEKGLAERLDRDELMKNR